MKIWSRHTDSNCGPSDYKSDPLATLDSSATQYQQLSGKAFTPETTQNPIRRHRTGTICCAYLSDAKSCAAKVLQTLSDGTPCSAKRHVLQGNHQVGPDLVRVSIHEQ